MLYLAGSAFGLALLIAAGVVLIIRHGSDDHDLESKLAAALEDEIFGAPEGWRGE